MKWHVYCSTFVFGIVTTLQVRTVGMAHRGGVEYLWNFDTQNAIWVEASPVSLVRLISLDRNSNVTCPLRDLIHRYRARANIYVYVYRVREKEREREKVKPRYKRPSFIKPLCLLHPLLWSATCLLHAVWTPCCISCLLCTRTDW